MNKSLKMAVGSAIFAAGAVLAQSSNDQEAAIQDALDCKGISYNSFTTTYYSLIGNVVFVKDGDETHRYVFWPEEKECKDQLKSVSQSIFDDLLSAPEAAKSQFFEAKRPTPNHNSGPGSKY